ncbi:MAG: cell wall-active antibiotics response protein [Chloroflexi bacterium]|nr:cell wall-active antibiotics response protein [Chloroflexota bacterium]
MRSQGQLLFGALFIFFGILFLFGTLFNVDVWEFCWPIGLILLGVWILARPRMLGADTAIRMMLLGNIRRAGNWRVSNEEFWLGVGDASFDLSRADVPAGESVLRCFGFVGNVDLIVPPGVGYAVSSNAFVSAVRLMGQKEENFVLPYSYVSDDFASSERKVRLEATHFVTGIRVSRP